MQITLIQTGVGIGKVRSARNFRRMSTIRREKFCIYTNLANNIYVKNNLFKI